MREILFRGKRLDNGEWVAGGLFVQNKDDVKEFAVYILTPSLAMVCNANIVDPSTVGQYTGLNDKNGKRIFEGDVVLHYTGNPYAPPAFIEKGEVFWDESCLGWLRTWNVAFHQGVVDAYRMSPHCVYEVIGNIHDNQELL